MKKTNREIKTKIKFFVRTFFIVSFASFSAFFPIISKADIYQEAAMLAQLIYQSKLMFHQLGFQQNIAGYTQQTLQQMMGTPGLNYGTDGEQDLQSWGTGAGNWNSALTLYKDDTSGALGSSENQLNTGQYGFPIQPRGQGSINSDPDSSTARYYTLEARTALTARAASQVDYDNIKKQIGYMNDLRAMIGKTNTVKDSIDLQNRIAVESNLIQLEQLRLLALSNQQQAIATQGQVNAAVDNANAFQTSAP